MLKRAILATGGMDSTVLLYASVEEGIKPTVITVNYGQTAFNKQLEMLDYHIEKLGLDEPVIIHIDLPTQQNSPGLFKDKFDLKDDSDVNPDKLFTEKSMRYGEFFVEGRNLIMLSYAMAYCSSNKIDEIQVGYLYGEEEWANRRSYKLITGDNSPHFMDLLNVLCITGFSHQMRIRAPFYEYRIGKPEVVQLGTTLGVNFKHTHSCYWPEPCGKCDNCLLRAKYLGDLA